MQGEGGVAGPHPRSTDVRMDPNKLWTGDLSPYLMSGSKSAGNRADPEH
jgi:hypothetical protein